MAPAPMGITLLSQAFTGTDISCSMIIKTTVGVTVIWRAQGKHRSGQKHCEGHREEASLSMQVHEASPGSVHS